jgi:hypothetical protein
MAVSTKAAPDVERAGYNFTAGTKESSTPNKNDSLVQSSTKNQKKPDEKPKGRPGDFIVGIIWLDCSGSRTNKQDSESSSMPMVLIACYTLWRSLQSSSWVPPFR